MRPLSPEDGPGLAVQRTALSWQRTALSAAALALIVLRTMAHGPAAPLEAVLLIVAVALGLSMVGVWLRPHPGGWGAVLAGATAVTALVFVASVLLGR